MVEHAVEDHSVHVLVDDELSFFSSLFRCVYIDIILVVVHPDISLDFMWCLHTDEEISRIAYEKVESLEMVVCQIGA